jgi:signal transduction histidine kinase
LELRDRIGIVKAENDNIGLGLSCSREISRKLGGDMKLKRSKKGLTSFVFKFPVVLKDDEDQPAVEE